VGGLPAVETVCSFDKVCSFVVCSQERTRFGVLFLNNYFGAAPYD
jgi:hypothetical protein